MHVVKVLPEITLGISLVLSFLLPVDSFYSSFGFELVLSLASFFAAVFVMQFFKNRYTANLGDRYKLIYGLLLTIGVIGVMYFFFSSALTTESYIYLWMYGIVKCISYTLYPIRLFYNDRGKGQLYFIGTGLFLLLGITEFFRESLYLQQLIRWSYYFFIELLTWKNSKSYE